LRNKDKFISVEQKILIARPTSPNSLQKFIPYLALLKRISIKIKLWMIGQWINFAQKTTMKNLLSFALLAIVLVACNKYEEGSNYSLYSAKARLVNTWNLVSSEVENGGFSTTNTGYSEIVVTFKKDDTYSFTGKFIGIPFSESGTWAFNSDKTAVTVKDSDGDTDTWSIIKLKNKELKVQYVDGDNTFTFEFGE
jgi:hypothetical protein